MTVATLKEHSRRLTCFGTTCGVWVIGDSELGDPREAVDAADEQLLAWHRQFSRFEPDSELSRLNRDPRTTVPVSAAMASFVDAAIAAARFTGGLVDFTLLDEIERAGYDRHHERSLAPELIRAVHSATGAAEPEPTMRWRSIGIDREARTITRPLGVRLDSGGIANGLFADLLGAMLSDADGYAVDCGGDLMIGGAAGLARGVEVRAPFDVGVLHTFEVAHGGVATSGIAKRSWLDADGRPAHHLLDPATGRPAYTGVTQVTALAPSAVEAEARAKAALLSGPHEAPDWLLPYGGLVVTDDGNCLLVEPA
jgi:thiamine biosynthesis lipoprotein